VLAKFVTNWDPHKTYFWQESRTDLVIGRRQGYELFGVSGKRLIDLHLNGGTYNLGHRNPELLEALRDALETFETKIFPSLARTALAKALAATAPWDSSRTIFAAEIGAARHRAASDREHHQGHTGLAVCTGDQRFSIMACRTGRTRSLMGPSTISTPQKRR
jgi:acetylornithine/succinyldiaminopimelate/putrescine aminotransferase